MKAIKIAIILMGYLSLTTNQSQAEQITFNHLHSSTGQNSALSGDCIAENDRTISCSLRQVMFSKKLSKKDAETRTAEYENAIQDALKDKTPAQVVNQEVGKFCFGLTDLGNEARSKLSLEADVFTLFSALCEKPTIENLTKVFQHDLNKQLQTCKVWDYNIGTFQFEKVNERKWVSNNGPQGECGVITVLEIERDPEYSFLYTYHQRRFYIDTESKQCKEIAAINEDISYSWKGKEALKADCSYIEFGMF